MERSGPASGPEQSGDYSYDMVHEVNLGSEVQPHEAQEPPQHTPARAGSGDAGGDYEYDEAHDF